MYRVTPSLIDSFRLFCEEEFMPLQDLESRIKGEPVTPTPAMLLGRAFHRIADGTAELSHGYYQTEGFLFDTVSSDSALALRGPGVPEVWCSRPLQSVPHRPLLRGRTDWISGITPWEIKTKDQALDPEHYVESLQWQCYLYMLGVDECRYLLIRLEEGADCWRVREADVLPLFRFRAMEDYINEWASRLVHFCEDQGLLQYLTMKEG